MALNIPGFTTPNADLSSFLSSDYARWFGAVGQTVGTSILDIPKYDIWLKQGNIVFRFPLLPESFKIGNNARNKSYNIEGLGEVTTIKSPNLLEFSFSSHFPKNHFIGCQYTNLIDPKIVVVLLENIKRNGPVRLIITGTPINMLCTIEKFPFSENGGDIDSLQYSITFKEYRRVVPRSVQVKDGVATIDNQEIRVSGKIPQDTTFVKPGDNLYKIARKQYGDGGRWPEIATKNSIRSPYLVFPGQKLVL